MENKKLSEAIYKKEMELKKQVTFRCCFNRLSLILSFLQTEIYKQSLQLAEKSYQEKEGDLKSKLTQLQKDVANVQQAKAADAKMFDQKAVSCRVDVQLVVVCCAVTIGLSVLVSDTISKCKGRVVVQGNRF